jgi:tripartite-type tricarboxylate transporter receptor subunit TctC
MVSRWSRSRRFRAALMVSVSVLLASTVPHTASAQGDAYPNQSIRILVGESPGGATDIIARLVAKNMTRALGQSVIVENHTGAAGSIASTVVAHSRPDGYTLAVVSSSYAINPSFMKLSYDPQADLVPVSLLVRAPFLLVTSPSLKVDDVKALLSLAAQKHGTLTYASGGTDSSDHLAGVLFSSLSKQPMTHVPYRGAGPALVDVMSGQVAFQFASVLSATPFVKQGQLKALAVSSKTRLPSAPQIPTVAEAGVPGYEALTWYGLVAPKGTPPEIVQKLTAAAHEAVNEASMRKQIVDEGAESVGSSGPEFAAFLSSQLTKFKGLVSIANGAGS